MTVTEFFCPFDQGKRARPGVPRPNTGNIRGGGNGGGGGVSIENMGSVKNRTGQLYLEVRGDEHLRVGLLIIDPRG